MKNYLSYFILLFSILAIGQNAGDLIVTEIMFDPRSSNEQDREWFEVYNTTNAPIDMQGWTIGDNSSSARDHVIASSSIVPANGYAVLVYNSDITENAGISNAIYMYGSATTNSGFPTFNNESTYAGDNGDGTDIGGGIASDNDDGIELIAPNGDTIDDVVYGFGYNGLNDWPAQGAAEAVSYQLNANALDSASNDAAANWRASTNVYGSYNGTDYLGTPGTANFGFSSGLLAPGDIVITELMFDPRSSSEQDREWFEVYNTTSAAIDLNGWTIVDNSSSSRNHVITSMTPVLVPANSYAVLVYNDDTAVNAGITNAIYAYGNGTGNSSSGAPTWNNESTYSGTPPSSTSADGPGLLSPSGILIDDIQYGFGYSGLNAWPAQGADEAVSYQLDADFLDSSLNDNAANWIASTNIYGSFNSTDYLGTPGAANFAVSSLVSVGDIIITEIMIDPSSSNEANAEYFEVYNTTSSPINLRGWTIVDVSSSGRNHEITSSAIVAANSYAVLAGSSASADNGGISSVLYAYGFDSPPGGTSSAGSDFPRFNNESSFSAGDTDGVALISPGGVEVDRVEYDYSVSGIGFPEPSAPQGSSYELGFSFFDTVLNDAASSWSRGITGFGDGDLGTPGSANDFNRVYTYDTGWQAPFGNPNGTNNPTADVIVNSGIAVFSSNTSLNELTITGGSLSANAGVELSVSGDIEIDGSLEATSASILFNGTTRQNISGLNVLNVSNLTLDNSAGLGNDVVLNLFGQLEIISGNLSNAGTFTFKSTASNTGVILEIPSGSSLTGDYRVERFIPEATTGLGRVFRFIASSVNTSSTIYENWQEAGANVANNGTHITGSMGSIGNVDMSTGLDQTLTGSSSAFRFSNALDQQWNPLASTNQPGDELNALDAYRLFIRGDRDPARLAGSIQANDTKLTAVGQVAQGDQSRSYDVESGDFLMIGNPYQAPVDMETALANSSNINDNLIYYWDPNLGGSMGQGAYTIITDFAAGGTTLSTPASSNTEFMQPGQAAFFVATSGANGAGNDAVIRFRESDKGTTTNLSNNTVFGITTASGDQLVMNLYDTPSYLQGSSLTDAVRLRFGNSYSNGIDDHDILKFTNIDETMAIVNSAGDYGIYSMQQVTDGLNIPLRITNYGDSDYTFTMDVGLFAGFNVYLYDNHLGTRQLLNSDAVNVINFSIDSNDSSSHNDMRFVIQFETQTLSIAAGNEIALFNLYPNPVLDGKVFITTVESQLTVAIVNSLGQQVLTKEISTRENSIDTSSLKAGVYYVTASNGMHSSTLKLIIQ